MIPILPTKSTKIEDLYIQKFSAKKQAEELISVIDHLSKEAKESSQKMIKTASANASANGGGVNKMALVNLFMQMLTALNLKTDEAHAQGVIEGLNQENIYKDSKNKTSKDEPKNNEEERKEEIKIASKSVRHSHYQIDISKDVIKKSGQQVYMVSCYVRDAYLGRYLIKRNYFFTMKNEKAADAAYDDISKEIKSIKEQYYEGTIDIPEVSNLIIKFLNGIVAEIKFEEDGISNKT